MVNVIEDGLQVLLLLLGKIFTLLDEAASTGAGKSFITLASKHTWEIVVSGAPTALQVDLEGSLDATNWYTLDSSTITTSEMRHLVNKPVKYIRANLTTLSGGTTPKVTVSCYPYVI